MYLLLRHHSSHEGEQLYSGSCDKSLKKSGRGARVARSRFYFIWGGKGTSELRPEEVKPTKVSGYDGTLTTTTPKQKLKTLIATFLSICLVTSCFSFVITLRNLDITFFF